MPEEGSSWGQVSVQPAVSDASGGRPAMSESRPGRHRPAGRSRPVWPIALGVAALCVVVAGGAAWGLTRNGGDHSAGPSGHLSSSVAAPPSTAWTNPSTPTPTPTPTPTSSTVAASAALVQLNACRATLNTGKGFVAAAQQNYADWSGHVYAQNDYDSGKISAKTAKGIWARTKAAGPADLKSYTDAQQKWGTADQKACNGLKPGVGADPATVSACGTRAAAMVKLLTVSGPVYNGWKAHQTQMTHTQEKSDDPSAYFKEWFGRVHNAQQPLKDYEAAAKAYQKAPACPGVSS